MRMSTLWNTTMTKQHDYAMVDLASREDTRQLGLWPPTDKEDDVRSNNS
ncbi:hypothetical protein AB5J62_24940 [Amycolatopsis sp. cg5]